MKWRSEKAAQKLKYCIEKTYEVEVICLSIRRERQRFMFVLCHVGRTASNIQRSTSCIEHVQILTQSPFTTIERTMKEFGVSNHLVKKPSIEQRKECSKRVLQNFFTMLFTHTPFFLYSQELFDCFHLFHRIKQVFASAQVTLLCPCSWCPLLECPFPYALLFFPK